MKIETIKELCAVIDACRRKGVESISIGDITLKLGQAPLKKEKNSKEEMPVVPQITDDELMFWSTQ